MKFKKLILKKNEENLGDSLVGFLWWKTIRQIYLFKDVGLTENINLIIQNYF